MISISATKAPRFITIFSVLVLLVATACNAGKSNEEDKLNAILVGDWQWLQVLTSDAVNSQNPIDLFLYLRACKETNTSYYEEFFLEVTDEQISNDVEIYNWLAEMYSNYPQNGYLAYLTALAGIRSIVLDRDEAIDLLTVSIQQNPTWPTPYIERTSMYLFEDRQLEAKSDFEIALLIGDNLCYLHIMKSLFEREDFELALQYLKPCLEINPGHATALAVKAHLLERLERLDEAIATWKKSIEIEPWSYKLKSELADCYEQAERFGEATIVYEEIVNSNAPRYENLRDYASLRMRRIESIESKLKQRK